MEICFRYQRALVRNLHEIASALMELRILKIFEQYTIYKAGESFFNISIKALFNDMMAHAIKVLDKNTKSASFWYIYNKDPKRIEKLQSYSPALVASLNTLAPKLKLIRDKTHFHIDKDGVLNPKKIWETASITGREIENRLNELFLVLNELYQEVFKKSFLFRPEDYDGSDVVKLLDIADKNQMIYIENKA